MAAATLMRTAESLICSG